MQGSFKDLASGKIAIAAPEAEDKHFGLGDSVTLKFQAKDIALKVVALFPRLRRSPVTTSSHRTSSSAAG